MRMRMICAMLVMAGAVYAEQPIAVQDRIVSDFAAAGTPVQRAVGHLAASQGLCVGTELFRKNLTKEDLAHPKRSAEPRPNVSIHARSRTLRATLDDMMTQVPSYGYQIHGEWINVGRRDEMADPDNPLNWRIPGTITMTPESIRHGSPLAVNDWLEKMNIRFALKGSLNALKQSKPVEPQTVTLKDPTLREYLNCANRLRGKTTWTVVVEPDLTSPGWTLWESWGVLAGDAPHAPSK